jgi:hypothetical protein
MKYRREATPAADNSDALFEQVSTEQRVFYTDTRISDDRTNTDSQMFFFNFSFAYEILGVMKKSIDTRM